MILNLAGTLLHAYGAWRIGTLPWVRHRIGVRRWWLWVAAVWVAYVVGVAIGDDASGALSFVLAQFSFHWLAALFLLSLPLLLVDLGTGFGRFGGRWLPRLRGGALALAGLMVSLALIQGWRAPVVTRYELTLPGLPAELDGTTLVAVSDLHLGATLDGGWLGDRVDQILALEPDLIVMLGDLTEDDLNSIPDVITVLRRLRAPFGVWAVTGNHEFHGDTVATIAGFESAGIQWLRDRSVELRPGLRLAGVDDLTRRARHGGGEPSRLESLVGVDGGAALLLSHSPLHVEAASRAGFDLMLSGHTHGGQIWPFGYLVRQRYPFFLGHYRIDGMHLLVGRGTGTWGPRMRLWQPGEILHVVLRHDAAA